MCPDPVNGKEDGLGSEVRSATRRRTRRRRMMRGRGGSRTDSDL